MWSLLGLPFAFLISWILVAPFLHFAMKRNVSFTRAVYWGAAVGAALVAVSISIDRYLGWRQSVNPNFSSRIGGDGAIRSIDGILTPYGWWVLTQNSIGFFLSCILVALLVRAIIGPGNTAEKVEV